MLFVWFERLIVLFEINVPLFDTTIFEPAACVIFPPVEFTVSSVTEIWPRTVALLFTIVVLPPEADTDPVE